VSKYGHFSALFLYGIVCALLMGACASERKVTQGQVRKDAWGKDETYSIGKDEDGNPVMKSDKRSSFENKSSNIASNRDFSGKDYTKKSYRKKRWGGDTSFDRKSFSGNTDANRYRSEPLFVQKQAAPTSKQANVRNKKFSINPFRSKRATEQGGRRITTSEDAEISNRRQTYKQPDITDWKDQDRLSIGDTNRMLGRGN
jgi:hypothetical protein